MISKTDFSDTVLRRGLMMLLLVAFAAPASLAQEETEEEFDPKKVVKQIQEDLDSIIESMAELSGQVSSERGKKVVENIDKLLEGMQGAQSSVVGQIDKLIDNLKMQQSRQNSSSGGGQQQNKSGKGKGKNQQRPQSRRDRNQREGERQREQNGSKPQKDGKDPKSGQESSGTPKQKQGDKSPDSQAKNANLPRQAGEWGFLPPEMRQALIENNFREYFPNYEKEIRDYLKSLNRRRRR